MRPRRHSHADARRAQLALVVVAIAAVLDRDGCVVANQAAVFGFVISALVAAGQAIGSAAGYIAVHLEAVVAWLISQFAWLSGHVAKIFASTGAMFARFGSWLRDWYNDFWKPIGKWLYGQFERLRTWLSRYFKPVFDFLKRVRDELLTLYKRFVKPILDVIDVARGFLRVLGDLGVAWAKALDQRLGQFESLITENFLRLLSGLNQVIDVVNSIVTGDLLLQRVPFLSTLRRDIHYANAALLQARLDFRTRSEPGLRTAEKLPRTPIDQYPRDLGEYLETGAGDYADEVAGLVTVWEIAADTGAVAES